MFGLLFLLIVVIGIALYVSVQARHRSDSGSPRPSRPIGTGAAELGDDLARWVGAGLVSGPQADAIRAFERQGVLPTASAVNAPVTAPRRRVPAVAEALGYLGGILAITGLVLVVARYWQDMATAGRLALSGAGAAALLTAGAVVREQADPALARLRWFLWLAATASTALAVGILTHDALGVDEGARIAVACSAAVTVLSGILWLWRERPVQQLTCLAGLAVFVGTFVAALTDIGPAGIAVWGLGAVLLAAGLRGWTPLPLLTEGVGAATLAVGALLPISDWHGFALVFAVLTGWLLVGIAVVRGAAPSTGAANLAGVVGGVLLLQSAPTSLGYFGHDAGLLTGLVTWAAGAGLVYIGGRQMLRFSVFAEVAGGLAIIGGAALTGLQYRSFAPLFGIATAIGLVALGTLPGRVLMSMLGSLGLLINVPWAIGRFFPGEGRAPLLIFVCGTLIIAVAVLLARMGGRFRTELHRHDNHGSHFGGTSRPSGVAR